MTMMTECCFVIVFPSCTAALLSETKDESEEDEREQNDTESGLEKIKKQEDVEEASSEGKEDVGLVSSITIDEIQLIRKYADPEVVRSIAKDLNLDSPESVDDMDIVQALERERGRRRAGQRERIRKALKKTNAKYEEILAEKRYNVAFRAEIPRLARRLLMTDVYPFAKALGYNSQRLSQFQVDYCLAGSEKGTNEVVRQQNDLENKQSDGDYRDCVPSREVLEELARQIPESEADRLCEVLGMEREHPGAHKESCIVELLETWVEQGKSGSSTKLFLDSKTG
ncbi:uncharacterized protein [Diadema antillarum]|uniref:uncharacterized protein n=1 Tax=Diadema antillarum TaxID=105358 RepID=UPI003A86F634